MATAKTPEQYRQAWQHHIDQLATLALAASIPYDEWIAAKQRLEQWLEKAYEQLNATRQDHE